jgi:hypothetical protein
MIEAETISTTDLDLIFVTDDPGEAVTHNHETRLHSKFR